MNGKTEQNMENHLTDSMLLDYLFEEMPEDDVAVVQLHLANCAQCSKAMVELAGTKAELESMPIASINTDRVIAQTTALYQKVCLQRASSEIKLGNLTLVFLKVGDLLQSFEHILETYGVTPEFITPAKDSLESVNFYADEGRVVMELLDETDQACPGVELELVGPETRLVKTDERGRIDIVGLRPGSYIIRTAKE